MAENKFENVFCKMAAILFSPQNTRPGYITRLDHVHHCICRYPSTTTLQWRHNDHDGVSNHQPRGCFLNRLFRRRSKKTSKLRVTGLCDRTGKFPAQVASNAENISIWWRHHEAAKKLGDALGIIIMNNAMKWKYIIQNGGCFFARSRGTSRVKKNNGLEARRGKQLLLGVKWGTRWGSL